MATSYFNVKGRVKWPKVYEPDDYLGQKRYVIQFYPFDGAEWEKIQKSGIQSNVKEDTDGKFITLRRPTSKLIGENLVIFCPPELTGAVDVHYVNDAGEKIRSYNKGEVKDVKRVGDATPIGNGTLGIVNFSAYDTRQGKGCRLEGFRVLDLVGIEPKEEKVKEEDVQEGEEVEVKKDENLSDDIPW